MTLWNRGGWVNVECLYRSCMPGYNTSHAQIDFPCVHISLVEVWIVTPTSVSFLDRLKVARSDDSEWKQFEVMYLPLVRRWISRIPGMGSEVEDVAQEVLLVLVREIPDSSGNAWARSVPGSARSP